MRKLCSLGIIAYGCRINNSHHVPRENTATATVERATVWRTATAWSVEGSDCVEKGDSGGAENGGVENGGIVRVITY